MNGALSFSALLFVVPRAQAVKQFTYCQQWLSDSLVTI
jgi:hypothetical protein